MSKAHINSNLILGNNLGGVDESLVAYFPFNNTVKDSINDWSPAVDSGNTLTENDGILIEGDLYYDISFDPRDDWSIVGETRTNGPNGWQSIFMFGSYHELEYSEFEIWLNHSSTVKTYSHDNRSGRSTTLFTPNEGELEEWFYWAATRDGSTNVQNVYMWTKDRTVKKTFTLTHSHPIKKILRIGGSHVLNGNTKNIALYDRTLNDNEILQLYLNNKSFYNPNEEITLL